MSKRNIWIFSLEPIETRYTKEWFTYLKARFEDAVGDQFYVNQIDGWKIFESSATSGAFLNFTNTNGWKSSQLITFIDLIGHDCIGDDDILFFTDFWNPAILQVKYMKDLMDKNWKILSIAHAGSYDPNDFLGRKVKDKNWTFAAETAMAEACDKVIFGTSYHYNLFNQSIKIPSHKVMISGFPMEYMRDMFKGYMKHDRLPIVLFPHRNAPEKQPELFDELERRLPQYSYINCMKQNLDKPQYHELLGTSKVAVSFALQETLGISMYEAMESNTIPLVPNRLSYAEMYDNMFRYNTMEEFDEKLQYFMEDYDSVVTSDKYRINLKKLRSCFFGMDVAYVINNS